MAAKQVLRIISGIPIGNGGDVVEIRIGMEPPNPPTGGANHPKLNLLREFLLDPVESKRREFIETFPEERNVILALEAMIGGIESNFHSKYLEISVSELEISMPGGEQFTITMSIEHGC